MEEQSLNLLILEDTPADAKLIVEQLEREGFTVKWNRIDTETAFREALEKSPDLILAGYAVPFFGAIDALKIQQENAPEIPLIVISGKTGEEAAVECMKSGAVDYVLEDRLFRLGTVTKRAFEKAKQHRRRNQIRYALQEKTRELNERVKELNCLYAISKISETDDASLEKIAEAIVNFIPPSWQYPEISGARIIVEDQEFRTENFRETIWKQTSDITVHDRRVGTIEVCCLEERPKSDEGLFLKEERTLINAIAERFGKIIERYKAEKTLIQSEKLRALGQMAGGVAHDFNNLLAIILGNVQLLERGLERYGNEEIRERLAIISRTASQGGETVRRLQYFTGRKISTDESTRLDLNEIVRSALHSTSPRWKDEAEAKGITITIKEELGKLPSLLGNESELMEVLTNLIFNAVEAMSDGGRITIKTETKENDVLLYFSNSGKGIPDRIKANVFEPFFTTKGPKASGLGLSISYGIIKRHKGDMKVESSQGKGTTFTITIPIPLESPQNEEEYEKVEKTSSQKILVIDDEEGVRDVLARVLGDEGHRVSLAENAREGLERFKKGDFDVVLTDLGMPDMSGWELARRIKKIDPSLPVGLITGWAVYLLPRKRSRKRE